MIGSIIGGALGAVGSIFGGITASKAMKKVKGNLEDQRAANENWYNRRYNEDATQRADAQRLWTQMEDSFKNRNRQAAATQAVMGGTEESVAASKAAANDAMANAISSINASADARKDAIERQYQTKDAQLQAQLNNMEVNKANAIAQAAQGVMQTGAGIAGAF